MTEIQMTSFDETGPGWVAVGVPRKNKLILDLGDWFRLEVLQEGLWLWLVGTFFSRRLDIEAWVVSRNFVLTINGLRRRWSW